MLILETRIGVYVVNVDSLVAVEKTTNNDLTVYTCDRILPGVNSSLSKIEKYCGDRLIYINRQCIINKYSISHIIPKSKEVFVKLRDNELKKFICSRNKFRDLIKWLNSIQELRNDYSKIIEEKGVNTR